MEDLEDRLAKAEHELQTARLDWLDLYAKARKLFGRVAKAQAREAEGDDSQAELPLGAQISTLSPRARLIQRQILERRKAMGVKVNGGEHGLLHGGDEG